MEVLASSGGEWICVLAPVPGNIWKRISQGLKTVVDPHLVCNCHTTEHTEMQELLHKYLEIKDLIQDVLRLKIEEEETADMGTTATLLIHDEVL